MLFDAAGFELGLHGSGRERGAPIVDMFTSIHIDEYNMEVRDTKRGLEELTSDIPNVSEEATKDLDENGLIRIGAEIKEGDILIGKITPAQSSSTLAPRSVFSSRGRSTDGPPSAMTRSQCKRPVVNSLPIAITSW